MKKINFLTMAAAVCCMAMSSCGDDEPQRMKYQSVDLGLSVKWATTNVGAQQPEDHGQLFGWADSTGSHKTFDNISIMYQPNDDGTETTIVQWKSVFFGGKNPVADISGTPFDIAIYHWNANWRMPTLDEWKELMDRCTWTAETTATGTTVCRVTGPNGNSIVLPMTGTRQASGDEQIKATKAYYWTSTLLPRNMQADYNYQSDVACAAWCVKFDAGAQPQIGAAIRCYGMGIRPVAK